MSEPDWTCFTAHGFTCFANRNVMLGCWCAYVGLPAHHPWAALDDYDDIPAEVHGGLTFSSGHHSAAPLGTTVARWIGWDCGHAGDFMPSAPDMGGEPWPLVRVRSETKRLAQQARAALEGMLS